MKKVISLLFLPLLALAQTNVQKVGSGNNALSNGSLIVPSGISITATGTGVIQATSVSPSVTVPWSQITATPTTLSGYGVTNTLTTTAPITGGGALSANLTIAMPAATGSVNGYLTSADWTTFNAKQPAGSYLTALTGDGTATGPGSAVFTLAAVASAGTSGSSTAIPVITINAKGLTTTITTAAVIAPAGTLTGTTLAAGVVTSSLTTVGTIGAGTWQGSIVAGLYGGTGVANSGKTITLGGNLATSGAFATTLTATGTTTLTLPTTGTLATLAGTEALTNKTYNGNSWTAGTGTLAIAAGKTITESNTLTYTGTDGSTVAFGTGGTVLYSGGAGFVASIAGTANEITASAATGAVTLSLPAGLTFTGKTMTGGTFNSGAFNGTLGATTPSTVSATTLTASSLTSGRVPYVSTAGLLVDSAVLTFNGTNNFSMVGNDASAVLATVVNSNTAGGARFVLQNNGASGSRFNTYAFGSTAAGTTFGVNLASAVRLTADQSALSALIIGNDAVNVPIVFGINTSEVGRFTSGTLSTGALSLAYTTAASSTTTGALIVSGGLGLAGNAYVGGQVVGSSKAVFNTPAANSNLIDLGNGGSTVATFQIDGSTRLVIAGGAGSSDPLVRISQPLKAFEVVGTAATAGAGSWSTHGQFTVGGGTLTDNSTSGTLTKWTGSTFTPPTFAFSAATTITDAATVYISSSPGFGANATITNNYGLWSAGKTRLDGSVLINNSLDSAQTGSANAVRLSAGSVGSGYAGLALSGNNSWVQFSNPNGDLRIAAGGTATSNEVASFTATGFVPGYNSRSQAAWGVSGVEMHTGGATYTDSSTVSGTVANAVFSSFTVPTLAATNASITTTNAATVYIAGPPTAGTNQTITNGYGLWNVGKTRVDAKVFLNIVGYAQPAWGVTGAFLQVNGATVTDNSTASGTVASAVFNSFAAPTLAATNVSITTTNAATVYISGGPIAGTNQTITNSYGLWNVGKSRFDGLASITDTTASSSTTTGALLVAGGEGIAGALYVGGITAISNGSSSNPALTFASSPTTGFYRDGADSIGVATAGIKASAWNQNGTFYIGNGNRSLSAWGTSGVVMQTGQNFTYTNTSSSGTIATQVGTNFWEPIFASTSAVTVTNAATLYINADPQAGTNTTITNGYGLWNAGKSKLVGAIVAGSTISTAAAVTYDFGASSATTITSPDKSLKFTVAGTDYYVPAKLTNN